MGKTPSFRSWRMFYDRLLKDESHRKSIDTARFGSYHTYREQFVRIDRLLKRYPRSVTPVPIGTSVGGEP
ncbi:MAG: hypothetical protein ABIH26_04835, partial [Candidatus Eisenbacteria bacterium]